MTLITYSWLFDFFLIIFRFFRYNWLCFLYLMIMLSITRLMDVFFFEISINLWFFLLIKSRIIILSPAFIWFYWFFILIRINRKNIRSKILLSLKVKRYETEKISKIFVCKDTVIYSLKTTIIINHIFVLLFRISWIRLKFIH